VEKIGEGGGIESMQRFVVEDAAGVAEALQACKTSKTLGVGACSSSTRGRDSDLPLLAKVSRLNSPTVASVPP